MAVTKTKVQEALEGINMLSVSAEHEAARDCWIVEVTDKTINLASLKYGCTINFAFATLSDTKKPEKLRSEIYNLFLFFAKGLETGYNLTTQKIVDHLPQLFMPPPPAPPAPTQSIENKENNPS